MRPPLTNIALFGFSISFGPLFSRARLDLWFLGLLHVSKMKTIQFKSFFPKKAKLTQRPYYRQKTTTRGWAGFAMNIVIVLRMRNRRNVTSGHGDNKCEIAQRFGHRSIPCFFLDYNLCCFNRWISYWSNIGIVVSYRSINSRIIVISGAVPSATPCCLHACMHSHLILFH